MPASTEDRLTDLESRLAFLENTLDQLNNIVSEQALTIDRLKLENEAIIERLRELTDAVNPEVENTRPPHY